MTAPAPVGEQAGERSGQPRRDHARRRRKAHGCRAAAVERVQRQGDHERPAADGAEQPAQLKVAQGRGREGGAEALAQADPVLAMRAASPARRRGATGTDPALCCHTRVLSRYAALGWLSGMGIGRGIRLRWRCQRGQAALLMLGVLGALLAGGLVLFGFGRALAARGHAQRAVDLAAVSSAQVMRRNFNRLFEPAWLEVGLPNPRFLSNDGYLALARTAALRGARRNGIDPARVAVTFPGHRFAPTRVTVSVSDRAGVRLGSGRRRFVARERTRDRRAGGRRRPGDAGAGDRRRVLGAAGVQAGQADASRRRTRLRPLGGRGAGGGGLSLLVTSGYRSDAEQARLFAAHPDPKWVAPPGTSLHRFGTELDLGPPAAYGWLAANAGRFRFVRRYSWEPWHYGYELNSGSTSRRLRRRRAAGRRRCRRSSRPPSAADRPGCAALERRGGAAGGAVLRRVRLRPERPQPGGGAGDRPVHAGHRRGARPRRPVRRGPPRSTPRRT